MPPDPPPAAHRLLNLALYQSGWFAAVWGAATDRPALGAAIAFALVLIHVTLARDRRSEIVLVMVGGGLGLAVDSVLLHLGIVAFRPGQALGGGLLAPAWIVALWMQFVTLQRFALAWLLERPVLAAGLGLVGGPVAFWAGTRLGAARLHPDVWPSLVTLAAVWAVVVPVLGRLARRFGPSDYSLP